MLLLNRSHLEPHLSPEAHHLTFDSLSRKNYERCVKSYHPMGIHEWTATDWACAMAGETGEACNLIKKQRRGEHIDVKEIGKELADVVIYADLLASRLGLNLGDCVRAKFNEVSDRVDSDVRL